MKIKALAAGAIILAGLLLAAENAAAQRTSSDALDSHKQVIGPRNPYLADGADALVRGDIERGVELTEKGLEIAQGSYELKAALSNLCAGYLLVKQPQKALQACNRVLEEDPTFWRAYNNRALVYLELGEFELSEVDIERGQELRPKSKNLELTKAKLLDATDPVVPTVEIDERRSAGDEHGDSDTTL
jgi:regulator of sirC expression with transglutaminase-like and TPR domain